MSDIVAVITKLRRNYKLAALLELAGIPRSTYYYHCKKRSLETNISLKNRKSKQSMKKIRDVTGTAGFSWICVIVDMF